MALVMIRTARTSDTADSKVIIVFDQSLIPDTSLGPKDVEMPNDMCR